MMRNLKEKPELLIDPELKGECKTVRKRMNGRKNERRTLEQDHEQKQNGELKKMNRDRRKQGFEIRKED